MAYERSLTRGEVQLCEMIFRESMPSAMVRIVIRKAGVTGGFTPFEKINVDEASYKSDYIGADVVKVKNLDRSAIEDAHWFLHELAHVWQYFVGMPKARMFFKGRREGRSLAWRQKKTRDLSSYTGRGALYGYRIDRPGLDL